MTPRLALGSLWVWMGTSLGCSFVLDFEGYRVTRDAGTLDSTDAGADAETLLPIGPAVASFDSYHFTRGTAVTYAVSAKAGTLANDSGENLRTVPGQLSTRWGGQVALFADGGFRYTPPGPVATFWGDDYFEYELPSEPPARARVRLTLQPPALSLGEIATSLGAGFGVAGAAAQDQLGSDVKSFAPAGDVNGDGYEDFVIGVMGPRDDNFPPRGAGRAVYVLFGKSTSDNVSLASLDTETPRGFTIVGDDLENNGDSIGYAVAGAGDVNADGYDDLVIGSHGYFDPAVAALGGAYVVFGKADAESVSNAAIRTGVGGFFIRASAPDYYFVGYDVSGAGDVNGDGYDDVIVGCPLIDAAHGGNAGAAFVVFGKGNTESVPLDLIAAGTPEALLQGFPIFGNRAAENLGVFVAGLGDVNGDALDDVGLGSGNYPGGDEQYGRSLVVFGTINPAPVQISELETDATLGFGIVGADFQDFAGQIAAAGDVDADGIDDILITAPFASLEPTAATPNEIIDAGPDAGDAGATPGPGVPPATSGDEKGVVYVVFGKRESANVSLRAIENQEGRLGFVAAGLQRGQRLGLTVSAGELNGDGASDLLLTTQPGAGRPGHAYVVFGKADNEPVTLSTSTASSSGVLAIVGPTAEETCGVGAAGADVNGDGLDDMLLSAALYGDAPQAAGGAYVAFSWDMSRELEPRDRALIGTFGSDLLELPPEPIVIARGGNGTDTLRVGAGTSELDLSLRGRYESLEVIDVRGGGPQLVRLDEVALRRIPQNHSGRTFGLVRTLTILGDAEDRLEFDRTGYARQNGRPGRVVWSRQGSYYGLEASQELPIDAP